VRRCARGPVEEKDEAMVSVSILFRAAAAVMISSSAYAADMPQQLPPPPPPQMTYQPMQLIMEQPASAWYLRGFIGVGVTSQVNFVFEPNPLNGTVDVLTQHASMGDTVFFGVGAGYEFNSWLRFDVTAEYRNKTPFNAFLTYSFNGVFGDQYNAFVKSDIFLANAYIDLGTWECITPFVGFGIGGAYNTWADLTDIGIATSGNGVGTNASQLNFAWALHAGLAYNVTQNFSFELAYRYLSYGSVSDQIICAGGCNPDTYKLQNLTSQDFMLGVRWRFPIQSAPMMVAPQPVMVQQAPVMQQAPVYAPQPMMVPQQAPVYAPPQYQQPYQPPQYPLSTRG
jgi:opacity protein-like surface antigen